LLFGLLGRSAGSRVGLHVVHVDVWIDLRTDRFALRRAAMRVVCVAHADNVRPLLISREGLFRAEKRRSIRRRSWWQAVGLRKLVRVTAVDQSDADPGRDQKLRHSQLAPAMVDPEPAGSA